MSSSLSQGDFRRMLETKDSSKKKRGGSNSNSYKQSKKLKTPAAGSKPKYEEHVPSQVYRDRALERREGKAMDALDDKEIQELMKPKPKGVDLSLLSQLKVHKASLTKQISQTLGGENTTPQKERMYQNASNEAIHRLTCSKKFEKQTSDAAYSHHTVEIFLPGRMEYVFDFNRGDDTTAILPRTILKSKEDCPKSSDFISGKITSHFLLNNLSLVQNNSTAQKERRRKKREVELAQVELERAQHEAEEERKKLLEEEEEEDIFPDLDEYVPAGAVIDKQDIAVVLKDSSRSSTSYFSNLSAKTTLDSERERSLEEREARAKELEQEKMSELQHEEEEDESSAIREKLSKAEGDDGYSECYPDYQDINLGTTYDSSDDDDGEGNGGKKKKGLVTTIGKDDRPKPTRKQKEGKRERKLDSDLIKINKIMKEKQQKKSETTK